MLRIFFELVFKILGWKIEGGLPDGLKKCVIIVVPHTSNWDFLIGVATRAIVGFKANYLIKDELFKYSLLAWFFSSTGGIPVNRTNKKEDVVSNVVKLYNERESLILGIAPEGTRSKVKDWKTGFYRIAHQANIPIVLVSFNYNLKVVKFIKTFQPTGDMNNDIVYIKSLYEGELGSI